MVSTKKENERKKFTTTLNVNTKKDLEKIKIFLRVRGINDVIEYITEAYIRVEGEKINENNKL